MGGLGCFFSFFLTGMQAPTKGFDYLKDYEDQTKWKTTLEKLCSTTATGMVWPPGAFDLLVRCLDLSPKTRITAEEALRHPFLREGGEGSQ